MHIETQKPFKLDPENPSSRRAYVVDLVVERQVIVEVKSVTQIAPVHRAQLLTYLKLSGLQVGLLINFNVPRLVDGLKRVVNNYKEAIDQVPAESGSLAPEKPEE